MDAMKRIEELKLVPVIKLDRKDDAFPLAVALCRGDLPVAEITFRTDAASDSITEMKKHFPQMLVGAGTIVNLEQANRALDAGADFFVTPGFSRSLTEFAVDRNIPIFPGICTPTELMLALEYGLSVVKFFPASQFGGLNTIKALSAPFPQIRFMPTGGINQNNLANYLSFSKVIACGGSWMVKPELINNGEFDEVAALTRDARELIARL